MAIITNPGTSSVQPNAVKEASPSILQSTPNASIKYTFPISPFTPAPVTTTIYKVPSMEPQRFKLYPANYLYLPLRRDILHKAVIYEGDMTRHGTANSKWRSEVHGSNRKIRPQKGMGRARLGSKKSPMLRGGGVAFGPKPRDFSTELPRKIYDLAWRTALSYRYRRGELVVVDSSPLGVKGIQKAFLRNGWAQTKGRDLIITNAYLKTKPGKPERKTNVEEGAKIDVKDILESRRLIIDERALDEMLKRHQSDLVGSKYLQARP